eukprot:749904-Pleurochrysis_carterae.AAC.1
MSSVNKRVRVECLGLSDMCAGNSLGPHGLDALAETLKSNKSLTSLDVGCACDACLLVLVRKLSSSALRLLYTVHVLAHGHLVADLMLMR